MRDNNGISDIENIDHEKDLGEILTKTCHLVNISPSKLNALTKLLGLLSIFIRKRTTNLTTVQGLCYLWQTKKTRDDLCKKIGSRCEMWGLI